MMKKENQKLLDSVAKCFQSRTLTREDVAELVAGFTRQVWERSMASPREPYQLPTRWSTKWGELEEFQTISEFLNSECVVSIERNGEAFEVIEKCDTHFGADLTPEQLRAWAVELILISGGFPPPPPTSALNPENQIE